MQNNEECSDKKEAMAYLEFKKEIKLYIINKEWLKQWKSRVKYDNYKPRNQFYYSYSMNNCVDSVITEDLPQINNEEIVINPSTYLRTKDDNSKLIKPDALKRIEIVNETIWKLLQTRYQGGPEIKFEFKEATLLNPVADLVNLKITFIIFPLKSELIEHNGKNVKDMKEYTIYSGIDIIFEDIKQKIARVILDNNLLGSSYPDDLLSSDNIHLWLLDENTSIHFIQNKFEQNIDNITKSNDFLDISKDFAINNLEVLLKLKFRKLFKKRNEVTFCIERSTPSSKFIFQPNETIKIDKCEYDDVEGLMTACCKCKMVWYCNEICLNKDKSYHEPKCSMTVNIDDDNSVSGFLKKMNDTQESNNSRTLNVNKNNSISGFLNKNKPSQESYYPWTLDIENDKLIPSPNSIKGLCGLTNLGNTCFMNTSLQCLSNCYPLTEYFISDKYKRDINEVNPLGSKGNIAKVYANFLKNLWNGSSSIFTPSHFKSALGNYLKIFSGFHQHDTQEFLNYLLDCLHEDLNRVLKKPILEKDETEQPDDVKSKSHWVSFLRRNQSVLVDVFYGQFKSKLTCPNKDCRNISITFEPFLSISLPIIPKMKAYTIKCLFIFFDINITPLYFNMPFYKATTFMSLRNKIGKLLNIDPWSFIIVNINEKIKIDEFIPETSTLYSTYSTQATKYFFFQIDPRIFYSRLNTSIKESNEIPEYQREFGDSEAYINSRIQIAQEIYSSNYEEDSFNKLEVNTNYGLNSDITPTIVQFMDIINDGIIFPRVLCLNKKKTIKELYFYIYETFYLIIKSGKSPQEHLNGSRVNDGMKVDIQTDFDNQFRDKTDENSFNEAFENSTIPFYIVYLPRNRSTKKDILLYNDEDILETYLNKYIDEPDHLFFSVNKLFTLGIVWNSQLQGKVSQILNSYNEPSIEVSSIDKPLSLYECLNSFIKEEVLEENNEWYCPKCKKHQPAAKKIEIYKAPNVLIVHLKRFNNNTKLDTLIDFPIQGLDISKYVVSDEKDTQYDLFAIANHYGSKNFGHYIAYAKNPNQNNKWYEYDDSHVTEKEENELISSSAYVLFYSKQNINILNWTEIYDRPFINFETTDS